MRARLFVMLAVTALLTLILVDARPNQSAVLAAGNVFSGPVNGGCYAQTGSVCRIHVDRWAPITFASGERLLGFRLLASGKTLYDFRTDVSNPPSSPYLPSLVRRDFAAQCGVEYTLTLLVEDTGSGGLVTTGGTNAFSCPLLETPTPTLAPTVTPNSVYLPSLRR